MKLIQFTFTNEYDNQSQIQINPKYVVTLRPDGKTRTSISLASKAQVTVDGSINAVAAALSANTSDAVASAPDQDYDPAPESA